PTNTPLPAATPAATATPTPDGLNRPLEVAWDSYAAALRPSALQQLAPEMRVGGALSSLTQYSLTVTLSSDLKQVAGRARVRYTNNEGAPLNEVYFHLFPNIWNGSMTVAGVSVDGRAVETILESGADLLRVPLGRSLDPRQWVEIALDFRVPIPADTEVGNYADFAYVADVLAMAHFYPTVVVYDDKGWHLETPATQGDVVYHDASLYDVSLTAPQGLVVAATGATLDRVENGDGTATWRLAGGPMRDFNVAASMRYKTASRLVGDITINSYFLPEDAAGGQNALDWAALSLQVYQTEFGAYPYRELDLAATETTAGGIEYPGLIVISRRFYSDPNNAVYFEGITTHEVAHQWWYNVVGNDQVNDPWLDEALTQYSTYFYYEKAYGKQAIENLMDSFRARWARVDFLEKPIGLPVSTYPDKEYGAIVYGRGPLFLIALRDQIGADKMAQLLRRYYVEYTWKIAMPADFRRLAEEISGQNLGDLWAKWVGP
ncbi:MAG: hypothetical protein QG637_1654, partial [Chloroflexota bacterium]|nr:hypothetical protein [Chloroflexota bacterium]